MIDGLPAVTGMRTATVAIALEYLAWVSNRVDTACKASSDLLAQMRVVLDRFVRAGLPYDSGPDGRPRFDLVELRNFVLVADQCVDDPFWREYVMQLGKRIMLEARADGEADRCDEDSYVNAARALPPR